MGGQPDLPRDREGLDVVLEGDRHPGVGDPSHEVGQVREGSGGCVREGAGAPLRVSGPGALAPQDIAFVIGPEDADEATGLGEGLARGRPDGLQRLPGARPVEVLGVRGGVGGAVGLHDDDAEGVGNDVVHLAGDPGALVLGGDPGPLVAVAPQRLVLLAQPGDELTPLAGQVTAQPAREHKAAEEDGADDLGDETGTAVGVPVQLCEDASGHGRDQPRPSHRRPRGVPGDGVGGQQRGDVGRQRTVGDGELGEVTDQDQGEGHVRVGAPPCQGQDLQRADDEDAHECPPARPGTGADEQQEPQDHPEAHGEHGIDQLDVGLQPPAPALPRTGRREWVDGCHHRERRRAGTTAASDHGLILFRAARLG